MFMYIVFGLMTLVGVVEAAVLAVVITLTVRDIIAARRREKAAQKRGFPRAWDK
jgi:hypothetical protein